MQDSSTNVNPEDVTLKTSIYNPLPFPLARDTLSLSTFTIMNAWIQVLQAAGKVYLLNFFPVIFLWFDSLRISWASLILPDSEASFAPISGDWPAFVAAEFGPYFPSQKTDARALYFSYPQSRTKETIF
jgi:hypothetical protein